MSSVPLINLDGEFTSSCGYCKRGENRTNSSISFGFHCDSISPEKYLQLLNCGWRRSGKFFYLPLNEKTCCPSLTIRTNCNEFELNRKSHKKIIKRIAHLVGIQQAIKADFIETFSTILQAGQQNGKLNIKTESSKFDVESWKLYKKYQIAIHKDSPDSLTERGYKRFLCDSPLPTSNTIHQKYFINGQFVAVGVIDLLPECLSSVYFFYDPEYSHFSLGIFSALYEMYHARSIFNIPYYYMGYYIRNCPKMIYKSQFEPCFLLNREIQQWIPFNTVQFDQKGNFILTTNLSSIEFELNLSNYQIHLDNCQLNLKEIWNFLTPKCQSLISRFITNVKNIPFTINGTG